VEILSLGRALGSLPGHPICVRREVAPGENISGGIDSGKWLGLLAEGLKKERQE
jgi:hypothetical protein